MNDKPLFGAGSSTSKHSKNRAGFLRPAPAVDGRLNSALLESQPRTTVAAVIGTKADRKTQTDLQPAPIPAQAPTPIPVRASAPIPAQAPAPIPVQASIPIPVQTPAPSPVQNQAASPTQSPVASPIQSPVTDAVLTPNPVTEQTAATTTQAAEEETAAVTIASDQYIADEAYPVLKQEGSMEDRKGTRKRALKGAIIIRPGQMMSTYACKIRNESSGGVMLILSDALLVPPEFYLVRDADPSNRVPCRVAWREKDSLGAEFVTALSNP